MTETQVRNNTTHTTTHTTTLPHRDSLVLIALMLPPSFLPLRCSFPVSLYPTDPTYMFRGVKADMLMCLA